MRYFSLLILMITSPLCFAEVFEVTKVERVDFYENRGFSLRRSNGQMAGYVIRESENLTYYNKVGMKVGDLLTHLNGNDLRVLVDIRKALVDLETAKSLSFTYIRDGWEAPEKALIEFSIRAESGE